MKWTLIASVALVSLSCQKREQASFVSSLEENQSDYSWKNGATNARLDNLPNNTIELGKQFDLYLGSGAWYQSACSSRIIETPSANWNVEFVVEEPNIEIEVDVRHCGVDHSGPWIYADSAQQDFGDHAYFPLDGGIARVSTFYIGKVFSPQTIRLTMASEGEDFLVTDIRIKATGKVKLQTPTW